MFNIKNKISRQDFLYESKKALILAALSSLPLNSSCNPFSSTSAPHRHIDKSFCTACGRCLPLCPMGAIYMDRKAVIAAEECAECGVCLRSGVCDAGAIKSGVLVWPRILREIFSNPLVSHKSTGVSGRGTEGIKCNDSSHRYGKGDMGVFIELGRPVLGSRFYDVERTLKLFRSRGFSVIEDNPVYELVEDHKTGALRPEVLDEKVISCLVEFIIPEKFSKNLFKIIKRLSGEIDSIFNVCIALPDRATGTEDIKKLFGSTFILPQVKVNIGMASDIQGEDKS